MDAFFFLLAGSEEGCEILWLCIGEYNGPKSAKAFLRYAFSRYSLYSREKTYRFYVSDVLRTHAENVAKSQHIQGVYYEKRLEDLLYPGRVKPAKEQTGGEIAADVIQRLGLRMIPQEKTEGLI